MLTVQLVGCRQDWSKQMPLQWCGCHLSNFTSTFNWLLVTQGPCQWISSGLTSSSDHTWKQNASRSDSAFVGSDVFSRTFGRSLGSKLAWNKRSRTRRWSRPSYRPHRCHGMPRHYRQWMFGWCVSSQGRVCVGPKFFRHCRLQFRTLAWQSTS